MQAILDASSIASMVEALQGKLIGTRVCNEIREKLICG